MANRSSQMKDDILRFLVNNVYAENFFEGIQQVPWWLGRRDGRSRETISKLIPLVTVYQIAETIGMTAEQVKEQIGVEEFAEWAVFMNSPFSLRNREAMLNAWLVHVIRSMMAPKNKKPKFDQSAFPFHKMAEAFF